MDGGEDGGVVAWLVDVAAAGLLGAACTFAGAKLGDSNTGLIAGAAVTAIRPCP